MQIVNFMEKNIKESCVNNLYKVIPLLIYNNGRSEAKTSTKVW